MNTLLVMGVFALLVMLTACLLPGLSQHGKIQTLRASKIRIAYRPFSFVERVLIRFVIAMRIFSSWTHRVLSGSRLLANSCALSAKDATDDLPALKARKVDLETKATELRAKDQSEAANAEALRGVEAEIEEVGAKIEVAELKARNKTLEDAVLAQRTKDAKSAVQAAVKRGAIPTQDVELQAKWEKRCVEDVENIELLASMKGSPALDRSVSPSRIILASGAQIVSDIREELRAYGREKDPMKRGALYAKSISPRIKELNEVPLMAADTYYTDIVAQRALELLKFEFPMLSRITTDFSAENARKGQSVITRIVTPPAVTDYHTTNGYVGQTTTTTDVSVTLGSHRHTTVKFDANVLASTFRNLFDEQMPAMHYSLGKDLVDTLYAVITTGNYTNTPVTKALIDFGRPAVISLGSSLTAAGVPQSGRTLLLNTDYYGQLMSDDAIVNLAANQRSEIITGNRLPNIHSFETIEAPNLPTTGNLTGFGFGRSALLLVTRVPTDVSTAFPGVNGGAVTQIVTNPDTGLSVLLIKYVAPQLGHAYLIMAWLCGVAKGQVVAGTILRSSA